MTNGKAMCWGLSKDCKPIAAMAVIARLLEHVTFGLEQFLSQGVIFLRRFDHGVHSRSRLILAQNGIASSPRRGARSVDVRTRFGKQVETL